MFKLPPVSSAVSHTPSGTGPGLWQSPLWPTELALLRRRAAWPGWTILLPGFQYPAGADETCTDGDTWIKVNASERNPVIWCKHIMCPWIMKKLHFKQWVNTIRTSVVMYLQTDTNRFANNVHNNMFVKKLARDLWKYDTPNRCALQNEVLLWVFIFCVLWLQRVWQQCNNKVLQPRELSQKKLQLLGYTRVFIIGTRSTQVILFSIINKNIW